MNKRVPNINPINYQQTKFEVIKDDTLMVLPKDEQLVCHHATKTGNIVENQWGTLHIEYKRRASIYSEQGDEFVSVCIDCILETSKHIAL